MNWYTKGLKDFATLVFVWFIICSMLYGMTFLLKTIGFGIYETAIASILSLFFVVTMLGAKLEKEINNKIDKE